MLQKEQIFHLHFSEVDNFKWELYLSPMKRLITSFHRNTVPSIKKIGKIVKHNLLLSKFSDLISKIINLIIFIFISSLQKLFLIFKDIYFSVLLPF